jgi:Na+-translocating ferredoxin:NAD+ oxidoreductase RnfE subunit
MTLTLDNNKIQRRGRVLNLSVMAIQLLTLGAITNVFVSLFSNLVGVAEVKLLGSDSAAARTGISHESINNPTLKDGIEKFAETANVSANELTTQLASTFQFQTLLNGYLILLSLIIALVTFLAIRRTLANNNPPSKINEGQENKNASLIKSLEQLLNIAPIAIGRRTAFNGSTLVLSFKDMLKARTSKVAKIKFIVAHELCHKINWDVSIGYIVKMLTIFNASMLAFFYGFYSRSLLLIVMGISDIWPSLYILLLILICYALYQLFLKGFYALSKFKEHLADEYALLKTGSLIIAEAAILSLSESKGKLHPNRQTRINYLYHRQSILPLELFLMTNLIWIMAYIIPDQFNMNLFLDSAWAEFIFMVLNTPLVLLFIDKKMPITLQSSALIATVLLALLLPPISRWYLISHYNPSAAQNFMVHFIDQLSLYHGWLLLTLIVALWPRKLKQ